MALTQEALYAELDLALSWSERDLPERERTRHVHRLHPYLGKFIPQLVEVLLARYFRPGQHVLDPFAGSGTTLVQALESDLDATGVDVAAFNCLLMEVKTRKYEPFLLERALGWSLVGPRVPIARVGRISLLAVQVGMNPGTCGAFVLLCRFVGPLPIAFSVPPQASQGQTHFAWRLLTL